MAKSEMKGLDDNYIIEPELLLQVESIGFVIHLFCSLFKLL